MNLRPELILEDAPVPDSLTELEAALGACRRCPLYKDATQAVPGKGPRRAPLMLVGEQPGNAEDLAGKPFVGPAGRELDEALTLAGIARKKTFVTNAVKHFKFEPRGKRRLHKRPNAYEIQRCRWWLERERDLVRPALTITLGATAARSVFGKVMGVNASRGKILEAEDWGHALVTIHPSALLRMPDAKDRAAERARFIEDLKIAAEFVG